MKLEVFFIFALTVGVTIAHLEIEIRQFQQLSDTSLADYTTLKSRKVNGTRALVGNITVNQPIDNTYEIEILAFTKQGGEYRMLPYKLMRKPFCDFFSEDTIIYEELCESSDFIYPAPCPFEVGTYKVRGFHPSLKNVPQMILHDGDYAVEIAVFDNQNKEVFRGRGYGSIINY